MIQLLLPVLLVLAVVAAGLFWASLNNRFAALEKEIEDLRTELLFLRGEMDLDRHEKGGT